MWREWCTWILSLSLCFVLAILKLLILDLTISFIYEVVNLIFYIFIFICCSCNNLTCTELATDTQKNRNKKELKEQRNSFRNFVESIEQDSFDSYTVCYLHKLGKEEITIESWATKCQVDAVQKAMDNGTHVHMLFNSTVCTHAFYSYCIVFLYWH